MADRGMSRVKRHAIEDLRAWVIGALVVAAYLAFAHQADEAPPAERDEAPAWHITESER